MSWEFSKIFRKYHCLGVISPLFLLVFFFSSLLNFNSAALLTDSHLYKVTYFAKISSDVTPKTATKNTEKAEKISLTSEKTTPSPHQTYLTAINSRQNPANSYQNTTTLESTSSVSAASNTAPTGPYMTLAGRILSIFSVANTTVDSGNRVALYGDRFYYGHRSTVFASLATFTPGTTFTITSADETSTYLVANTTVLNHSAKDENGRSESDRHMNALVRGVYNGATYDVVMMTCAGESLPGGDSTDRLVIFANKI